jgi:hypothetical protein
MTPTGKQLATGLRRAVVIGLGTSGLPAATGTAAYEGFEIIGPKAYTLTIPDVRKVVHVGEDRVLALDFLPPTEASSAEIRASADDNELNAFLTGVKEFTVGDAKMIGYQTDMQGSEPDVALLLVQQSLDTAQKARHYRFHILPLTRVIPAPSGMDENAAELKYAVAPNPTTKHVWGTAIAAGTEGATELAFINGMSKNKPNIVAFKANGSTSAFLFPTAKPAKLTTSIEVWDNGVLKALSSDYTVTTAGVTFTSPPTSGHIIVVLYEY